MAYTPVWTDPACALALAAQEDLRVCDDHGRSVDDPERERIPDHPEQVPRQAAVVAAVTA